MTIEQQFIEHREEIRTYLFHRTGGDNALADDLTQDLFLKIIKIADSGKYVEEGKFLYWLKRIAGNMVIDHYRQKKRKRVYSNDGFQARFTNSNNVPDIWDWRYPQYDEEYQDSFVSDEMKKKMELAVKELPKPQQELIHMRFFRNMSYKEIVLETGEKQSNLLPRMHYAIKKLRIKLKDGE